MNSDSTDSEAETQPVVAAPGLMRPFPTLWTVEDVAAYLRLEVETIRSMARRGELPAIKVGRVWRFRREQIQSWLQEKT
jgi:excisionase family DNA binding protein